MECVSLWTSSSNTLQLSIPHGAEVGWHELRKMGKHKDAVHTKMRKVQSRSWERCDAARCDAKIGEVALRLWGRCENEHGASAIRLIGHSDVQVGGTIGDEAATTMEAASKVLLC